MESYPGDLLAGVFPLVFCVDAILQPLTKEAEGGGLNDSIDSQSSKRSLFDLFLDAMATSVVDQQAEPSQPPPPKTSNVLRTASFRTDAFGSLLRGEDMDSSDEEDMASLDSTQNSHSSTGASTRRSFRVGVGSPSLGMSTFRKTPTKSQPIATTNESVAYARNLSTEKFFQRARILSISTRHGFPPSKDPEGEENFTLSLSQARSLLSMTPTNSNAARLKRVLEKHPIDGILPSGWLEKHVHALPSVLVLVASHGGAGAQEDQDQHLLETMEHLRESLASKRDCQVHLVVVTESPADCRSWVGRIRVRLGISPTNVAVLEVPDLETSSASPGMSVSTKVRDLCKTVRSASWTYYSNLAKRNRKKLSTLGHEHQMALMPLGIRYCFKVAVFYEFMLKHEKSLKFFSEAYRHIYNYYTKFVRNEIPAKSPLIAVNPQGDEGIEATLSNSSAPRASYSDDEGGETGVEVELADSDASDEDDEILPPIDIRSVFAEMSPPMDMGHQCRAVADWLNFKLVQAGFESTAMSESDEGLIAANSQWRKHAQVFLKPDDDQNPAWHYWLYVSQQRHVISQLTERYPPKSLTTLRGLARDELLQRCSPWRNYQATADAMLRTALALSKTSDGAFKSVATEEIAKLRGRFVGGLDSEWLGPVLRAKRGFDYKGKAIELMLHAIVLFEGEVEREKNKPGADVEKLASFYNRSGARLYYLAGGILLGNENHKDAIAHLEKAVKYSSGWTGLELAIRRLLIECYEKHMPSQAELTTEQNNMIASMILDSYFNAEMSSRNLRRALENFSKMSSGSLKWHHECIDESDSSLPFSFSVTFQGKTHATAGDSVSASVLIKSNLDYAVHVNSVTLKSFAGDILVPSMSLLSAENANEGSEGGIIIQAKTVILFSTTIKLPKNIDKIESDESGNGGEREGTAGKGSFAKSARPRTAGITSAAGARLISEHRFGKDPRDRNAQWSVRYLGGKTLRCDGMCLVFYPVHAEKSAAAGTDLNVIEYTIVKKKPKTAANIRRTPFEEDNYVASAWTRPKYLPLKRGPRCLRVLGPTPKMTVTNLSDTPTNGKALEGTVNRILLKLEAGEGEEVKELRYKLSSSSTLLSMDGKTTNLGPPIENGDFPQSPEKLAPPTLNPKARTPVMVKSNPRASGGVVEKFGYPLPPKWDIVGSGFAWGGEVTPEISTLKSGESCYVYFDLYRPAKAPPSPDLVDENGGTRTSFSDGAVGDSELCETTFDLNITYRQGRPKAQQMRSRRRARPSQGGPKEEEADTSDVVQLEYSGSVVWTTPFSAEFTEVHRLQKAFPAGSRHPSNYKSETSIGESTDDNSDGPESEIALVDGERVTSRCTLESTYISGDMSLEIRGVTFEKGVADESIIPCEIRLVPSDATNQDSICATETNNPVRKLMKGSQFGFVYTVQAKMDDDYKRGSVSTNLGVVCVDWAPIPLSSGVNDEGTRNHGPLAIVGGAPIKFRGLACYVESAPFDVEIILRPTAPRVGVPFDVVYKLKNQTSMHQHASVSVADSTTNTTSSDVLLISGVVNGELMLAPGEVQMLSYTAMASVAGEMKLPAISISSNRFKTWVVNDGNTDRCVFILP